MIGAYYTLEKELSDFFKLYFDTELENATPEQAYYALAQIAKKKIYERYLNNPKPREKKTVHYLSIEFLIGKSLKANLINLGIEDEVRSLFYSLSLDIDEVYGVESDAALGNGGLGRLAACYLESLAREGHSAFGHSILYENGLFKQKILNGKQQILPDEWLTFGSVWLNPRPDCCQIVEIGGELIENFNYDRGLSYELKGGLKIRAVPYDLIVSSYGTDNITRVRLWRAEPVEPFDFRLFELGEYEAALKDSIKIQSINKLLYPNDNSENGKNLRLIQQYFLVSASMQNVLQDYFRLHSGLDELSDYVAVHINDTHPALCVPELMRLLLDKYEFGWDESYGTVKKIVSYTNHTILSESLEFKSLNAIEKFMPRIAKILYELDRRFRGELGEFFKNDYPRVERLAIISNGYASMANLAISASHTVNGVSEIHSKILKDRLFADYSKMWTNKFINITNGISFTRWLCVANADLASLISQLIGSEFMSDNTLLKRLAKFEDDPDVLKKLRSVKYNNKVRLANFIEQTTGVEINPAARFDVQIKRIHEYKRQLMFIMKIIYIMSEIKRGNDYFLSDQVFIFAGKAASGYEMAGRIIELISSVAKEIDSDPELRDRIRVVFLENYNVSLAELLIPATDVSEQISLAGREASGTGNMKAVLNGALMLCTDDGANAEICDKCGKGTMFEFGLSAEEVQKINERGYNPMDYYSSSDKIRIVLDKMNEGIGGKKYDDMVRYLLGNSSNRDNYMCLADFESYIAAHNKMDITYRNQTEWNKRCLHAISQMSYFSADRSIRDYADKIWHLPNSD